MDTKGRETVSFFSVFRVFGFWCCVYFCFPMADVFSTIPAAVLRNLSDKLYEKRKNAALEVFNFYFFGDNFILGFIEGI